MSMADQELKVVCTEEEEKQRGRRVEEEETPGECSATEAETQGTHTLTDQQEPPCSNKDEKCLACQSVSVPTETSEHQLLSDQKAQPAVELFTPKQTLDCLHEPSPRLGVLGDQDGKNKFQGHGGKDDGSDSVELNQEQEHNDLEAVGRDQEPEQKQGNQETPKNTALSENIENQMRQTPDQHDQEGAVPVVMVTNLEEASVEKQAEDSAESEKQEDTVPADANPAASPSDVNDFSGSDLQSLKSDTLSLLSETAISGKSDEHESLEEDTRSVAASSVMEGPEEDTRSVTASSVMSLFQRMQMDPLEREWLRCATLGNATGLRQLLLQDPTLAPKKDFVTTALHWAAKQGRIETVDMMVRSGADVNQRAGYTPLHLASLHGHAHIIQLLIHNYNAKVNIRDYHGKMPCHYWNGSMDVFNTTGSQSGGKWSRGRRGQRYGQLSALLSRSRSQGSLRIELEPGSLELTPRLLPRSEANIQAFMETF